MKRSTHNSLVIFCALSCLLLLITALCACQKADYSDIVSPSKTWITGVPVITEAPVPDSAQSDTVTEAPVPGNTQSDTVTEAPEPDNTQSGTVTEAPVPTVSIQSDPTGRYKQLRSDIINNAAYYDSLDNSNTNTWCFERKKGHLPSGSYEEFKISDYDGYFLNSKVSDSDKVIYLTFDCGYPSDNTAAILDTLSAHNAKAAFFVTKMYLEGCTDYAVRMKREGHMVCNHTVSHTDLRNKSVSEIVSEIFDCAEYFYNQTGYEFDPFLRTPSGTYTKRLLTLIGDAGYTTIFWSIAYGDYDNSNPPAPGYVTNHFATYHHNGAVALIHNDCDSNVRELDAVLTLLENEGYRFGLLDELTK